MKSFLLDALAKPFLAILFFLAFGGGFVYAGFEDVVVQGTRAATGVSLDVTRSHFWGLIRSSDHLDGVTSAEIESRRTGTGTKRRTVSGVFLKTPTDSTALFSGDSNVDGAVKRDATEKINAFIAATDVESFSETFTIANIFGWVGLPFLLIGISGILGWPFTIIRFWRRA